MSRYLFNENERITISEQIRKVREDKEAQRKLAIIGYSNKMDYSSLKRKFEVLKQMRMEAEVHPNLKWDEETKKKMLILASKYFVNYAFSEIAKILEKI